MSLWRASLLALVAGTGAAGQGMPPGSSGYMQELFDEGPDGGALFPPCGCAAPWVIGLSGGSTATFEAGAGKLQLTNVPGASARLSRRAIIADSAGLVMRLRFSDGGTDADLHICFRCSADWLDARHPFQGHSVVLEPALSRVSVERTYAGSSTLVSASGFIVPAGWQWVRIEALQRTVRARTWPEGSPEPSSWDVQAPDASYDGYWLDISWARDSGTPAVHLDDLIAYYYLLDGGLPPMPPDERFDGGGGVGPASDGGTSDGGAGSDGGTGPEPRALAVGCGCSHAPALLGMVLVCSLWLRRGRRLSPK